MDLPPDAPGAPRRPGSVGPESPEPPGDRSPPAPGDPASSATGGGSGRPPLGARLRAFWARHRTLFWILHSGWALATGVVVIVLAHERYGFIPWVVVFLVLTWASTMFFGRRTADDAGSASPVGPDEGGTAPSAPGLLDEFTSYATRIMYQETLFFLLPFYAYSTVFLSPNVLFLVLLGGLAVLSCLDLLFDRWIRSSPVFGLVFFASVAFAGLNLVLPLLLALPPRFSAPLSGVLAVAGAVPLALRAAANGGTAGKIRLAVAGATILALAVGVPRLVPPVPLRMQSAEFGASIDRETLALADTIRGRVPVSSLPEGLVVVARVFAPSTLPTLVSIEWTLDGVLVRTSREVEVLAHDSGFRLWDALRPGPEGLRPGTYRVTLLTRGHRVFGVEDVVVEPPRSAFP